MQYGYLSNLLSDFELLYRTPASHGLYTGILLICIAYVNAPKSLFDQIYERQGPSRFCIL